MIEFVDSAVISTEWNPLGQVGAVRLGTGARRTIGYDVHGWVRATGTSTRSGEFYEYIRYADNAAKPRYNGYISRREWGMLNGAGNVYDYTYDGQGFLTGARHGRGQYSVDYAYDARGNMLSMTRRGVTDMLSGGLAAAYGVLDDVAASYSGNRLTGLAVTSGAKTFSRRTGIGRAGSFSLGYDESGRLVSDGSRGISSIDYDGNGHALSVLYSDGSAHSFNRDGLGNLTGTVYMERCGGTSGAPVVRVAEEREYTSGGHVIVNGRLVMSRFGGGYFDASGKPHYYVTDWQGNNIGVVDRNGLLEQRTDYYPYCEPWLEPEATMSGQGSVVIRPGLPVSAEEGAQDIEATAASSSGSDTSVNVFLFGDKERTRSGGLNEYRFPARDYVPGFPRFATIDPMCEGTPWLSPYAYCAGNPVMYIDPSGAEVRGASRADAKKIAEDLKDIFRDETFNEFRTLITNNGSKIAKISEADISAAFEGVELTEDQQALVDMAVNTINSEDKHVVEYIKSEGSISFEATDAFRSGFEELIHMPIEPTINKYNGIPVFLVKNRGGEGLITSTSSGTYTLVFKDNKIHRNGRSVTLGHELFGHARALSLNIVDQHQSAIQTENLILRIMGIDYIRDGSDHGNRSVLQNPTALPNYR